MNKKITQMIKGIAILLMIAHHFIIMPFAEFPYLVILFGQACKICVAIYAVLSGYGYFFVKEKTIRYGLKKIWSLLQNYWISLFMLFIPAAVVGGWKITPWKLIVQLFGLLPNLNWFAWYVFFYIFCVSVMPILCKYNVFRFKPFINLALVIVVPYVFQVTLYFMPNYETNTVIHDLYSCFLYFPCFLVGYWMAENQIIEIIKKVKWFSNLVFSISGIAIIFVARILINSIAGLLLDVIYAPVMICCIVNLFEKISCKAVLRAVSVLGKYSTGMWFFHAVFFSTYVCEWFQPIVKMVSWAPLMYVWLVVLSLAGAVVCQKILDILCGAAQFAKRSL